MVRKTHSGILEPPLSHPNIYAFSALAVTLLTPGASASEMLPGLTPVFFLGCCWVPPADDERDRGADEKLASWPLMRRPRAFSSLAASARAPNSVRFSSLTT